jgi:hypothetical protein
MHLALPRTPRFLPLLTAALCLFAAPAGALTLTARSGGAPAGNPDPIVTQLDLATTCGAGYPGAFGAFEFNAALAGPPAVVLSFVHPLWIQGLPCDPLARWIGRDANATPMSSLYAFDLVVPDGIIPCCIGRATLDFCWSADDGLGDTINPAGLYLNWVPIPSVQGGPFTAQHVVTGIDVTNFLHCGHNEFHIYDRDVACSVSGIIFSATLNILDCVDPTVRPTWGKLKAIYR